MILTSPAAEILERKVLERQVLLPDHNAEMRAHQTALTPAKRKGKGVEEDGFQERGCSCRTASSALTRSKTPSYAAASSTLKQSPK